MPRAVAARTTGPDRRLPLLALISLDGMRPRVMLCQASWLPSAWRQGGRDGYALLGATRPAALFAAQPHAADLGEKPSWHIRGVLVFSRRGWSWRLRRPTRRRRLSGPGTRSSTIPGLSSTSARRSPSCTPSTAAIDYSFASLPGRAVFTIYGFDADVGWIYHTNRAVIDAAQPAQPVSTFEVLPEPGTAALAAAGAAAIAARRARWRRIRA